MQDRSALEAWKPNNVELVLGDTADTVAGYLPRITKDAPLGFISIDVDYYSSTVPCLSVRTGYAEQYLPYFPVYLDDIAQPSSCAWVGNDLLSANSTTQTSCERSRPIQC